MALFLFYQGYVVVLLLFNMLQLDWELFKIFLKKCASGHKCCHFEVIYHDVVIRGKLFSINWDNTLKCTGDQRLFKNSPSYDDVADGLFNAVDHDLRFFSADFHGIYTCPLY